MAIRSQVLEQTVDRAAGRPRRTAASGRLGASAPTRSRAGARWLMVAAPPAPQDDHAAGQGPHRARRLAQRARQDAPRSTRPVGRRRRGPRTQVQGVRRAGRRLCSRAAQGHGLVSEEVTPFATSPAGGSTTPACCSGSATPSEEAGSTEPRTPSSATSTRTSRRCSGAPRPPAVRLRGAGAHRSGGGREARGPREALPLRRRRSARSSPATSSGCARSGRPTASCRSSSARRPWSSASTSRRSTPSTCATSRPRPPTTPSAAAAPAAAARPRWCSPTASSQSPHDQYFFRDPKAMVHGEVRPPLLDLANRDLVESHLQAVWLACTEEPLDPSIAELLVLDDPKRPAPAEVCGPRWRSRVSSLTPAAHPAGPRPARG